MEETRSRLDAVLGPCFNSGPAPGTAIAAAEAELGLLFPPSYRIFLSRFGASLGEGFEVHGLPPPLEPGEPPQWSNVVESTIPLRPDCLPDNTVEVSHDGMDHGYFLECSQSDSRFEGPVIEWGPDHDGGKVIVSSFVDFVEGLLRP